MICTVEGAKDRYSVDEYDNDKTQMVEKEELLQKKKCATFESFRQQRELQ